MFAQGYSNSWLKAFLQMGFGWFILSVAWSCVGQKPSNGIAFEIIDQQGQPYRGYSLRVSLIDSLHQKDSVLFHRNALGYEPGWSGVFLMVPRAGYYRVVATCDRTETTSYQVIRYLGKRVSLPIKINQRQYWFESN